MTEKVIEEYPDYTVDEKGNVYSYKRNTKIRLRQNIDKVGYPAVSLSKDGIYKRHNVHRLVAKAFLPNPDNKPCVNHKNSVRHDNRVENLEWATYSENNQHAKDYGYNPAVYGEDTSCASLTNEQAREIYLYLMEGHRNIDAAKKFNTSLHTVTSVKSKRAYSCATHDLPALDLLPHSKKISENTIRWICNQLQDGLSSQQVFDKMSNKSVKLNVIKDIKRRKTYTKVSSEYIW